MKTELQDILTSGLLERYLLGETNPEEDLKVQQWLNQYPEIQSHFAEMEADFAALGQEHAIPPPAKLKQELLKALPNLLLMDTKNKQKPWYLAIAASLVLLMGLTSMFLLQEMNEVKNQLQIVQQEKDTLSNQLIRLEQTLAETISWNKLLEDPNTQKYLLKGNELSPNALAIGYVNHKDRKVLLDTRQLPELTENQDYQLWADVNGVMMDLGVVSSEENDETLIAMRYLAGAESLNLTIEPAGGSEHPTVANLIANVYLE